MAEIAEVLKYEGDNSTFIWKHPCEDFNSLTQLIVHESQEAILFMNGQALDLFGAGRHTLKTQNIPITEKFFNWSTGNKTPFHCEIYFINKTEQMAIKWGTDSKVEYIEPTHNFPLQIGASGEMNLRVDDSRKLLVKVVGTEKGLTQQSLVQKLRAFLMVHIKPYLSKLITEKKINIFQIDNHLIEISDGLLSKLSPDFLDYGIALERFFVTTIVKPEDDKSYQKFKELHFRQYADVAEAKLNGEVGIIEQEMQAKRTVIEAQGIAQKREIEGYSYQDERGFDVAERVASNEAVGQVSNMGIGIGMIGVGSTVGARVGGIMQDAMTPQPQAPQGAKCHKCGTIAPPNAKFCLDCGEKIVINDGFLCPKCGAKTPKGKFCVECGTPLINKCPNCGKEGEGKFCIDCGSQMEG